MVKNKKFYTYKIVINKCRDRKELLLYCKKYYKLKNKKIEYKDRNWIIYLKDEKKFLKNPIKKVKLKNNIILFKKKYKIRK